MLDTGIPLILQNAPQTDDFRGQHKQILQQVRGARWLVCHSGGKTVTH